MLAQYEGARQKEVLWHPSSMKNSLRGSDERESKDRTSDNEPAQSLRGENKSPNSSLWVWKEK